MGILEPKKSLTKIPDFRKYRKAVRGSGLEGGWRSGLSWEYLARASDLGSVVRSLVTE